jgi:hypothetical protein
MYRSSSFKAKEEKKYSSYCVRNNQIEDGKYN